MNVKEIVKKFLEDNGFDGLWSNDNECGCEISDLMPCGQVEENDCSPGVKIVFEDGMCDGDCRGEKGHWHIAPRALDLRSSAPCAPSAPPVPQGANKISGE